MEDCRLKRVLMKRFQEKRQVITPGLLLSFVLLVLFSGCGSSDDGELIPLKVVSLPYLTYTTFHISEQERYFEEQGLDVEFVKFPTSPQAIPMLAQGDLDVVAGAMSASLMNAIAQNINVRIVAGREVINTECENVGLVVRTDLYESGEIDTIEEVRGRTVVIPALASLHHFVLTEILDSAGMNLNDVTVDKMRSQDIVVALDNGAIEAAVVGNPSLDDILENDHGVLLQGVSELLPLFQQSYLIFGPSLLDDRPEVGEKFMVAYIQGLRDWAEGKSERNLEMAVEFTGMDRETLLDICWNPVDPDGNYDIGDVLAFQDWAYANDFIDEKVEEEDLFDNRYLEYAMGVLGPAE
jgi:NitT/TauT family transport system substrate-binding protein